MPDYLILLIVCALVGAVIGKIKDRVMFGALLGLLLGPIGWLITALVTSAKPICPMCKGTANSGAIKCHRCGSSLNVQPGPQFDMAQYEAEKRRRGIIN